MWQEILTFGKNFIILQYDNINIYWYVLIYYIYVGSSYFFILDSDLEKIAFHEST